MSGEGGKPRAWIRLPSGGRLDLINPDPQAWTDTDLAIRLSRTYRWGGESSWTHPLSVAQHSLTVLALRRQMTAETLDIDASLLELLHDAEEGFLGFDCISPLKAVLGDPFRAVGDRLTRAIFARYSLVPWSGEAYPLHKRADAIAAASEALRCAGWTLAEIRNELGITHPILSVDPLASIYDCAPWEPWPAELAAERFHAELAALVGARNTTALPL
ncbi:phosphohydrolase [Ralstonia holmesii]|uniref:phosphohydrolase n=1 Tax=Ralstonia holmesii TaxID=3058602 RepID=UPI003F14757E